MRLKKIFGVTKAIPRIIGQAFVQNKLAVIVGVNKEDLPESISCISGNMFGNPNEVVVGHELANHFSLNIGDQFSMRGQQRKTFTVVGFFSSASSIWGSSMILMSFKDAGNCSASWMLLQTYKSTT